MSEYLGPYLLGPNDENQGIYTGDARELAPLIPDESVDLIFTDPVYQNIDDYRWLAVTAARMLRPDGQALIYQAHKWLDSTFAALRPLNFVWMLGEEMVGAQARYWPLKIFVGWRPLLWYAKTNPRPFLRMGPDLSRRTDTSGDNHRWRKRTGRVDYWMQQIGRQADIVFDPFTGGGSVPAICKKLGRQWLAFEIVPEIAEQARERVRMTQPPLFVPEVEQLGLGIGC